MSKSMLKAIWVSLHVTFNYWLVLNCPFYLHIVPNSFPILHKIEYAIHILILLVTFTLFFFHIPIYIIISTIFCTFEKDQKWGIVLQSRLQKMSPKGRRLCRSKPPSGYRLRCPHGHQVLTSILSLT